jgi:hypothetical protein
MATIPEGPSSADAPTTSPEPQFQQAAELKTGNARIHLDFQADDGR